MLRARIATGLVLGVTVTATILFLPTRAAASVLGLLWIVGAWEWAGLAGLGRTGRAAYAACVALAMLAWLGGPVMPRVLDAALGAAVLGWVTAFFGVLTYPRDFSAPVVLAAGVVALLPAWVLLVDLHAFEGLGPALALTVLALVWAADVGAYFIGRAAGRVKLAPQVSPGKTWEGVSGGVVFAIVVAWAASLTLDLPALLLIAVGTATALVSVIGDLTVSMLKRNRGLKDAGSLLPGHGGVLDRIDGLVAAIPFFALGLHLSGILR